MLGDGPEGQGGILTLGTTEMRAHGHGGTGVDEPLQSGQSRPDPEVVCHLAVFEGNVEIGAHQCDPSPRIHVVDCQVVRQISPRSRPALPARAQA